MVINFYTTNMKSLLIASFLVLSIVTYAQKGSTVTPSYYVINIGSDIKQIVAPNQTIDNLTNDNGENIDDPVQKFNDLVAKGIQEMTSKYFREKLDITIAPLDALKGKINYSTDGFPSQYSFKKVLKKAPGEAYYLSYGISMYKKSGPVGLASAGGIAIGGKVKPTTEIKLMIADTKGKVIQEFEVKEKTDIVVGSTKTSVGAIDTSSGEDPEIVAKKLMEVYENALEVLLEDYLKKNKKQYK